MAKVFNVTTSDNKKVEEFYEKSMKELKEFFKLDWSENAPKILLVPDRQTFDDLYEKKTERWVVGSTMMSNEIFYVLAPEAYERESSHKYSDKEYFQLIKHELCHLFSNIYLDSYKPVWFTEGMAVFCSGQLETMQKPKKLEHFLEFFSRGGAGVYNEAGFAFEILWKELGQDKIVNTLQELKHPITEKSFRQYFNKNFNIDLTYDWFNERL